jgi:hypothetical protein
MSARLPKITDAELQKELDELRPGGWTEEMDKIILLARDNERPIPYSSITNVFKKRGWNYKRTAIHDRYEALKQK